MLSPWSPLPAAKRWGVVDAAATASKQGHSPPADCAVPRHGPVVVRAVRALLHGGTLAWYVFVWCWHFSEGAKKLPGASGFGWFYKYMTFWSFSLQIITLSACLLHDLLCPLESIITHPRAEEQQQLQQQQQQKRRSASWLSAASDDLSCMSFAFAHVVTIMFHAVKFATSGVVEGAENLRPPWLNPTMHITNSLVAWAELVISRPRSFSPRARLSCCGLAVSYTAWILLCKQINGRFPYPFLNGLPFPSGFLLLVGASVSVFVLFFQIGTWANEAIGWALAAAAGRRQRRQRRRQQRLGEWLVAGNSSDAHGLIKAVDSGSDGGEGSSEEECGDIAAAAAAAAADDDDEGTYARSSSATLHTSGEQQQQRRRRRRGCKEAATHGVTLMTAGSATEPL